MYKLCLKLLPSSETNALKIMPNIIIHNINLEAENISRWTVLKVKILGVALCEREQLHWVMKII
jgi:hypothetical protein